METIATPLIFDAGLPRSPVEIDLIELESHVVEFLDLYADQPLVGPAFRSLIGEGDGESRFARLLGAARYGGNPNGFFADLLDQLRTTDGKRPTRVVVGGVELPDQLVLAVLEVLIPGQEIFNVNTVRRLERLTNTEVADHERKAIQTVLELYPVRFSSHIIRQMRLSPNVAYQYMPSTGELDDEGLDHTWVGQFHRGVIEQMYRNRVIFVLNMSCPVYCRFCFRKHKECRTQKAPTQKHVDLGVAYIRECPEIKEIVLTGGDPFVNRPTLTRAIDRLATIPHIETLRLATRSLAFHPALFFARDGFWIDYLTRKQLEFRQKGKRIEVATHFIHPDEVSVQSLDAISELVGNGVPVYVQTPLLGGCNDSGDVMKELFSTLRGAGAEMHYIFMPCSPIHGNARYVTPISRGIEAAVSLRGHSSDRAIPHLCTATAIGKIDWGTNGWIVGQDEDDPSYLWLRTPYTSEFFESFAPILDLSSVARVNDEGTLDARYMVESGDPKWLRGPQGVRNLRGRLVEHSRVDEVDPAQVLADLQQRRHDSPPAHSMVDTGLSKLSRPHMTRVEIDCESTDNELTTILRSIAEDNRITDVVLYSSRDPLRSLHRVGYVIEELHAIPHVNAVRIRSQGFASGTVVLSEGKLKRLRSWNRLSVARPLRIEVEIQLLHSSELESEHKLAVGSLLRRGITVYNSTPLCRLVNDSPEEIARLTSGCRRIGIENHHLVVAGSPIQLDWNRNRPVQIGRVLEIADHLRLTASGRELPRLVVHTTLGEVDFGLTGEFLAEDDDEGPVKVRLLPYDLEYYRSMNPKFRFPKGTEIDGDGHPIVAVPGLVI